MSKRSRRVARLGKQQEVKVKGSAWMSPAECAEEIGVTRQHIHDLIAAGKVSAKQFSPKVKRVARSEWERYLSAAPNAPVDAAPAA